MDKNNFIMLDGTVNTLPEVQIDTEDIRSGEFKTSKCGGGDCWGEFKEISPSIDVIVLCDDGKESLCAFYVPFIKSYFLDGDIEIVKHPCYFTNYGIDITDEDLWYCVPNVFAPNDVPDKYLYDEVTADRIIHDCYGSQTGQKVIGWRYITEEEQQQFKEAERQFFEEDEDIEDDVLVEEDCPFYICGDLWACEICDEDCSKSGKIFEEDEQ